MLSIALRGSTRAIGGQWAAGICSPKGLSVTIKTASLEPVKLVIRCSAAVGGGSSAIHFALQPSIFGKWKYGARVGSDFQQRFDDPVAVGGVPMGGALEHGQFAPFIVDEDGGGQAERHGLVAQALEELVAGVGEEL